MNLRYGSVKSLPETARSNACRAVNKAIVDACRPVGRTLADEEQPVKHQSDYGTSLLKYLAQRLTDDVGKGFDEREMRRIRQFYLAFPIRDGLRHELSWTPYRLLPKIDNEKARRWYVGVMNGSEYLLASQYELFLPTEAELKAELAREKFLIEQTRQAL